MIREGKKAEVVSCKQGKTLAPVACCIRRPLFESVPSGVEHMQSVRDAKVQRARTVTSLKSGGALSRVVCKKMVCSDVGDDITIKRLFHI